MGIELVAAVFCTYAWAKLISSEEGPGGVFLKLRLLCGAYDYGEQPDEYGKPMPRTRLGRMIKCPYCLAPYVAAVFVPLAMYAWGNETVQLIMAIFGVAGLCFAIQDLR